MTIIKPQVLELITPKERFFQKMSQKINSPLIINKDAQNLIENAYPEDGMAVFIDMILKNFNRLKMTVEGYAREIPNINEKTLSKLNEASEFSTIHSQEEIRAVGDLSPETRLVELGLTFKVRHGGIEEPADFHFPLLKQLQTDEEANIFTTSADKTALNTTDKQNPYEPKMIIDFDRFKDNLFILLQMINKKYS